MKTEKSKTQKNPDNEVGPLSTGAANTHWKSLDHPRREKVTKYGR